MQSSLLTLALVLFVSAVLGDDDCAPKPGQKMIQAGECCDIGAGPESMKTVFETCLNKYPLGKRGPRPSGPPPTGPPPTPSTVARSAHACIKECMFSEKGLLTADKKLDKAAVIKHFTTNPALTTVATAAVEKCFATYQANVDTTLECKSGAKEFSQCMKRETFLTCPSALWTDSADCRELKAKVAKCPMMPVMLGAPRRE